MVREVLAEVGQSILQWARPEGWVESPLSVSVF